MYEFPLIPTLNKKENKPNSCVFMKNKKQLISLVQKDNKNTIKLYSLLLFFCFLTFTSANAQTGNMLLFGVNLSEGNFSVAMRYFLPVLAFALGIALAEIVHKKDLNLLHWRQAAVLVEALILLGVAFFPQNMNLLANSLTSFACGIQVESFRKIRGNGIATTMCIGNMRSGTQNLCNYLQDRDIENLKKALLYYGIIICFICGAIIGNFFIKIFAEKAILCCSALLFFAFILMFIDYEREKEQ